MPQKPSDTLPKMMPKDFLTQLPEAHDLTDNDDDKCPVCLAKYRPRNPPPARGMIERLASTLFVRGNPEAMETEFEVAVRLPCQHVLGAKCMKRWVSPVEGGQTTCPYCIQPLFHPTRYPTSTHPLFTPLLTLLANTYGLTLSRHGLWLWDPTPSDSVLSAQDLIDASELYPKGNNALILRDSSPFFRPAASSSSSSSSSGNPQTHPRRTNRTTTTTTTATNHETRPESVYRLAFLRKTRPLIETVRYLQVQTWAPSAPLPPIPPTTRLEASYPHFAGLDARQTDALYGYFETEMLRDLSLALNGEGSRGGIMGELAREVERGRHSREEVLERMRGWWDELRELGVLPGFRWEDKW